MPTNDPRPPKEQIWDLDRLREVTTWALLGVIGSSRMLLSSALPSKRRAKAGGILAFDRGPAVVDISLDRVVCAFSGNAFLHVLQHSLIEGPGLMTMINL